MNTKEVAGCNGCCCNSEDNSGCSLMKYTDEECPCMKCMIKMMCDMPCKEFLIFRGDIILSIAKSG
jgi:hypothetical protein